MMKYHNSAKHGNYLAQEWKTLAWDPTSGNKDVTFTKKTHHAFKWDYNCTTAMLTEEGTHAKRGSEFSKALADFTKNPVSAMSKSEV